MISVAMCEMCGNESELVNAIVEGTMLRVCRRCSSYGDSIIVEKPDVVERRSRKIVVEEESKYIVKSYGTLVKKGRENKKWKQDELANKIGEKVSVIHKIESGHLEPAFGLALKLEKALGISLISTYTAPQSKTLSLKDGGLTIGDLIKFKGKRKL